MSSSTPPLLIPGRPTWQQTMLRISDPAKSIPYYTEHFGMTLIDTMDFPQYQFKLYFLTTLPQKEDGSLVEPYTLTPGTKEAHEYLWSMDGTVLELTHNYGTETDSNFKGYHPGNADKDGFGHIAFNCSDVYDACSKLESAGVSFKKKPDEGRMKGLAFAYDPDGYWVEIVKRSEGHKINNYYNLSQTMLRIKDPAKSIPFYRAMGMTVLRELHFGDFSLYFLASSCTLGDVGSSGDIANIDSLSDEQKRDLVAARFQPVLELTHNHGTEKDEKFKHYNGNEEGRQGFGHIGFLVDDVYKACDAIKEFGYGFRKEPDGGSMKGLAFAYDPDGYSIEIIKRGGIEFGDKKANE